MLKNKFTSKNHCYFFGHLTFVQKYVITNSTTKMDAGPSIGRIFHFFLIVNCSIDSLDSLDSLINVRNYVHFSSYHSIHQLENKYLGVFSSNELENNFHLRGTPYGDITRFSRSLSWHLIKKRTSFASDYVITTSANERTIHRELLLFISKIVQHTSYDSV
jgi:hypothetical protein